MKVPKNNESLDPAGKTSSDPIVAEAANVDAAIAGKEATGELEKAMAGAPAPEAPPGPDPVMASTLKVLVEFGVNYLHNSRDWSDPGQDWKEAVAQLGARLIDKYMPDVAQQSSDELALGILIAPWVISNLMAQKKADNVNDNVDGNVKNVEVKPEKLPDTPKEVMGVFEVQPA